MRGRVFLVEVAGLREMFGEQLLDMGRAVERLGQLPELGGDRGDDDIGEAAAGFLRGARRGRLGGERVFIQPFDHGAEQRFLGLEMMIERLPRQAGGLGRLLDRRAAETLAAEHGHRGVEDAGRGGSFDDFDKMERNVK